MKYLIECSGCDDTTQIMMELTDKQLAFVEYLANQITETSTCVCMPKMCVCQLDEVKEWELKNPREVEPFSGTCKASFHQKKEPAERLEGARNETY